MTENLACTPESDMRPIFLMASAVSFASESGLGSEKICETAWPSNKIFEPKVSTYCILFARLMGKYSMDSWFDRLYGDGSDGIELTCVQQYAKVVFGIYVEELRLDFPVFTF